MTTHRTSRRAALGLLGLGSVPVAAGGPLTLGGGPGTAAAGERTPAGPVPADLRPGGALDKLLAQRAAADQYSGTYLLLRGGRPVLSRSYGMADKSRSLPNGRNTIFELGSVTTMFTGIAVTQLVQQGKIAYHERLGTHLDGFPAEVADKVTVHRLLTHTSGMDDIYNEVNGPVIQSWSSEEEVTAGLMRIVRGTPLLFPGGPSGGRAPRRPARTRGLPRQRRERRLLDGGGSDRLRHGTVPVQAARRPAHLADDEPEEPGAAEGAATAR